MSIKIYVPEQIFTVENILSKEECAEYIALSEKMGYMGAPITTSQGFEMRPDVRNNDRVILDDGELAAVGFLASTQPTKILMGILDCRNIP